MNKNHLEAAINTLQANKNITLNPLAIHMTTSFLAAIYVNSVSEDTEQYFVDFLTNYNKFDSLLRRLPEYYEAGMGFSGESQGRNR